MRTIIKVTLSAMLLLAVGRLSAQKQVPALFEVFIQTMPMPQPTLKEMLAQNISNDAVEKMIHTAFKSADQKITFLYEPIYERFQNAANNPDKAKLSAAEQSMLTNVRLATKDLTAASQFDFFRLQMLHRAVVGNGKPLWALSVPVAKTNSAQKIYLQLKSLEASFDWKAFFRLSDNYVMKFASVNKNLDAVHKKFNTDLQKIPRKKVTTAQGFELEVEEPQKAIALWQNYGINTQQAFAQEYVSNYTWWKEQFQKLKAIGASLDALSSQLANDPEEAGSIDAVLIDLQIRTWEALYKLMAVTQRLYNDRLVALINEQQVKEAINMYKEFKPAE